MILFLTVTNLLRRLALRLTRITSALSPSDNKRNFSAGSTAFTEQFVIPAVKLDQPPINTVHIKTKPTNLTRQQ